MEMVCKPRELNLIFLSSQAQRAKWMYTRKWNLDVAEFPEKRNESGGTRTASYAGPNPGLRTDGMKATTHSTEPKKSIEDA